MPTTAQSLAARGSRNPDQVSLALQEALARYETLVRHVAQRHNVQGNELDELIQDVRIRLWRALSSSEKIGLAPASYVYQTARSAAIDLIRRRRARPEQLGLFTRGRSAKATAALPDKTVEAIELAEHLADALMRICESRRLVVRMHLAGYHRHEIAEILGWTEAKTRNLLYRGLADLRQQLQRRISGTCESS